MITPSVHLTVNHVALEPARAPLAGTTIQDFRVNNHLGEDWNYGFGSDDLGKPIYSAADGQVVYAQDVGGDGSWSGVVIILHTAAHLNVPGGGVVAQVKSLYGHLDPSSINTWVAVGANVVRGQQIGVIGPTPTGSTGPHLHFEIRTNVAIALGLGYSGDATGWVDPSDFIDANRSGSLPPGITQVNLNGALVSADNGGIVQVKGARIISASTDLDDYVVLEYHLRIPARDLQPVSATVYPDIGVFYIPESIFVKNVAAEFILTRNTQTFQSSSTYTITAANDQPLHMILEAGTTLCFHLNNPSRNYHFIIQKADSGEIIRDSYYLAGSNWAAWKTAILAGGEYLVFFQAENATSMTLEMTAFNSNRFPLSDLTHGSSFSASFREGSNDYRKWRIFLQRGQTLTVTKTSASGSVYWYLLFEDSTSAWSGDFATFAYIAKQTGNYYLISRAGATSGSCAGTISTSGPAMSYTVWRNLYEFPPSTEYADRDPDGDGVPNFVEYALDTNPLRLTSSGEFQSLSVECGNAVFSVTKPKFATGAAYQILSGADIHNLNNRSVQILPNPADPAKEDLKIVDPQTERQFYQLRITNSHP